MKTGRKPERCAVLLPPSEGECVFSGARPSSGAAAYVAIRRSNHSRHPLFSAVAAPEDGRAPLNRYEGEGRGEGESGALTTAVSNVTKSHGHPAGALQAVAAPIKPHLMPVQAILA